MHGLRFARMADKGFARHLFTCCFAADQTDAHQISYMGDPKLEEGRGGFPLLMPSSRSGQFPKPGYVAFEPGDGSGHGSARSREGSAPPTARSLSPEEKQKEKERLQNMVKEFAKAAIQGQQCQWLQASGVGGPLAATFSIDRSLRTFTLQPADAQAVSLGMGSIREVLKDVRDTPFFGVLPQNADEALERRFVCLQYEGVLGEAQDRYLAILTPNPYERERFYTCMKILRWAMDSRREKTG